MDTFICQACFTLHTSHARCTKCAAFFIKEGAGKNVIDHFTPTCLIHRYAGSDLLEPAVIVKAGKKYYHVATRLLEYAHPVKVPKAHVFYYDLPLLDQVNKLRRERREYVEDVDARMSGLWSRLQPLAVIRDGSV